MSFIAQYLRNSLQSQQEIIHLQHLLKGIQSKLTHKKIKGILTEAISEIVLEISEQGSSAVL